jgi:Surface antigen variable number repeat
MKLRFAKTPIFIYIFYSLFLIEGTACYAGNWPPGKKVVINDITITGIKKTKPAIVLRELGFSKGDSIVASGIEDILLKAKQQLTNTGLFLHIALYTQADSDSSVIIHISVKERWYIFPAPVFSLADRNFNIWWKQQMRSLERVNYGLSLDYRNVTGHNDNLAFGFQTGYTYSWGVFYNRPNIGKKQKHEVGFNFIKGKNREVNYASMYDRKSFFRYNQFIRRHTEGKIYYTYRKNIYTRHHFSAGFMQESVKDTVAKINPQYLGKGRRNIVYPEFVYRFSYNNTNNIQYPLKGKFFSAEILCNGLGKKSDINLMQLKLDAAIFIPLFRKTYFNTQVSGKVFLPRQQPFIRFRGLGYNDKELLRGLDEYVLDGNAYGVVRTNLKRELLSTTATINFLPKHFRKIPFQFFVKGLFDAGYVNNHYPGNNKLVNRWLFTKGIGLDVVSYYDVNIAFEYSFNQVMESGLFVRIKFGL